MGLAYFGCPWHITDGDVEIYENAEINHPFGGTS
jgi:hypothetical protein